MKENDVVALATLLNKKPEDVSAALEGDGIGGFINEFKTGNTIMSLTDFSKRETNLKDQVIGEIASSQSIPQPIYNRVKGDVLEMTEKKLAEKYKVDQYESFDDLINKLVTKAENPTSDAELKAQITKLTEEHSQEVDRLKNENNNRFVSLRVGEAVRGLNIDADGDKLNVQREIVSTMFNSNHKFEVDGDNVIVLRKKGDAWEKVTDAKLDPIPVSDVLAEYAKGIVNLKSSDSGGRGDSSSTSSSKTVSASKYLKDNNLTEVSFGWAEAYKKFKAEGYTILE
jgi:hypothetical protein